MSSYAWDHKGKILCQKILDPPRNVSHYESSIDIWDCTHWFHKPIVDHLRFLPTPGYSFDNQPKNIRSNLEF